tara:strand:- start:554 stop:1390 length:837 start_codon:yes stop_codon:yes gene_type:complete
MIKKIQSIIHLIRFGNIMIANLVILVSYYILGATNNIIPCMLFVSFSMGFGNILNDIIDMHTDSIAHSNRPLITGKITKKESQVLLIICFVFILVFFGSLNSISQYTYIIILFPLLVFYTSTFKKIPFLGNIVIAFLLAFVFIFTEMFIYGTYSQLVIPALLAFGLSWIRELIKDINDYDGDYKYNINTVPVYFGINFAKYFVISLILTFSIAILLPYFFSYYTINYFISLIFLIEIPLYILVFLLLNKPTKTTYTRLTYLTKYMVIAGLVVLYITTI